MLNFGKEELKMEQASFVDEEELWDLKERRNQAIMVTAAEYAQAAQYRTLLMTLRKVVQTDSYSVERVANAVVAAFDELEGAKC